MDEQLHREFLADADDLIEELCADLRRLRERRLEGRARRESVGSLFRRVHSLKGSVAAAGLAEAGALIHEFENLLDAVRLGSVPLDDEVLDACDEAADAVSSALSSAARGVEIGDGRAVIERLRRTVARGGERVEDDGFVALDSSAGLPYEIARSLNRYERQRLREAVQEGARARFVAAEFGVEDFDERFRALSAVLNECGEVIATLPYFNEDAPDSVCFHVVCASVEGRDEVAARLVAHGARLVEHEDDASGAERDDASGEADAAAPSATPATSLAMSVRVSLDELDELISSLHKLYGETARALDLASARGVDALDESASRVRRHFTELEERLINLRMVPIGPTLERAARAGRSVARAAGKNVDFDVEGGEAQLDRSLAESLADPLLHLLRNAVDHAVETEAERIEAGKSARGRVRIEARVEGNRAIVSVADDGRGVDSDRVARAAAAQGLIPAGASVSDEQALRLIFRPGFSTADKTSEVSGRGVGLDVVERAIERMGGELRVRSERGRGTTFELRVPTTLALMPALTVRTGGFFYCLDARHIADAGRISPGDIESAGDGRALSWRGRALSFVGLRELLGLRAAGCDDDDEGAASVAGSFVVVRAGSGGGDAQENEGDAQDDFVAVGVDDIESRGEVLVRGLGRHASRWHGVTGAAETGDEETALVLDLPRLLEK